MEDENGEGRKVEAASKSAQHQIGKGNEVFLYKTQN
jgi:hypothetical protein